MAALNHLSASELKELCIAEAGRKKVVSYFYSIGLGYRLTNLVKRTEKRIKFERFLVKNKKQYTSREYEISRDSMLGDFRILLALIDAQVFKR